jgi:hypothetical protein
LVTNNKLNHLKKALLIILLGAPFLLVLFPADYFDNGESLCLSVRLFDVQCLGCGLTRATMHLIHFEMLEAWKFNKLVFIIFPIATLFWLHLFGKLINKKIFEFFNKWY